MFGFHNVLNLKNRVKVNAFIDNVDVDFLFWLGSGSDVDLARGNIMDGHSFRKESSNVLLLDARHHHAGAALLPVHWGGHLLGRGELEAVDHADDLVEVPAGGGG